METARKQLCPMCAEHMTLASFQGEPFWHCSHCQWTTEVAPMGEKEREMAVTIAADVTADMANEYAVWMLDVLIDLSGRIPGERQIEFCKAIVALAEQFGLDRQVCGAVKDTLEVERLILKANQARVDPT